MIDENFQYELKKAGQPSDVIYLSEDELSALSEKMPENLIDFIREVGLGVYYGGLYRMWPPEKFKPILALVFGADEDFSHKDCYVLGETAFGELWGWSEKWGIFRIDLPSAMVFCSNLTQTEKNISEIDLSRFSSLIFPIDEGDVDYYDYDDEVMYQRCVEAHQQPARDQCFGFFPALALSGVFGPNRSVENIRLVKALEHYTLLAQMDRFYLTTVDSDGYKPIRVIG
ncbi:GAD-like domain-containing protein [Paracoccaceae bacterium GXU_MW_L88]